MGVSNMSQFSLETDHGLSSREVAEKQNVDGYNELPSTKQRSIFAIALEVMREPMFLLLIACGTIYLVLGDIQEAIMLLATTT